MKHSTLAGQIRLLSDTQILPEHTAPRQPWSKQSQATIPIPQGGWAGELSAMKGKLEPTLTGYTESQILGNNIARPNWQLELSHGGRMYTRAVG